MKPSDRCVGVGTEKPDSQEQQVEPLLLDLDPTTTKATLKTPNGDPPKIQEPFSLTERAFIDLDPRGGCTKGGGLAPPHLDPELAWEDQLAPADNASYTATLRLLGLLLLRASGGTVSPENPLDVAAPPKVGFGLE
jgi:hypothetical protein